MSNKTRERLLSHPAIQLLKEGVKKEQQLKYILAACILITGFLLLLFFTGRSTLLSIIGLGTLFIGCQFLIHIARNNDRDLHQLFHLLRNEPHQIVWVYSVVTQRMPFGFYWSENGLLFFKLANREEITVHLKAKHLKLVSKTLGRLLPQTTFGYSSERDQWYQLDPQLLIKDKDHPNRDVSL